MATWNLARLNHVLIPRTKAGRDKFRSARVGRLLRPAARAYDALSREGQMFALVAMMSGALGLDVRHTEVYALFCALASLLFASVILSRGYRLKDVTMAVSVPRRVTVGEPARFTLALVNAGTRAHASLRVRGPFLPWDGKWTGLRPGVRVLRAGAKAEVDMFASFSERGEHHLDPFRAAALVPLGLALGPAVQTDGCRFLVVPRCANVTALRLPLGARHQPGGVALASKTGESMDLLGVRAYRPGDPVRDLHARSWAKTGAPAVREYQQEYFSRVGVVLDTDRTVSDERTREAAISLAAGVIARLSRGEALIDLLVVGDRVHGLTLGRSLGFLEQALDLLACVEAGPALGPDTVLERLGPHLPRLSCVVVVALAWDGPRASLDARLRGAGIGVKTLVMGEIGASPANVIGVQAEAVERGGPLAL